MNDPKFDVRDALNQALAKGLKKGALSYLTLALQPYGSLIVAAKYAGEVVTKVRLNPVEFEPGQAALDETSRDYLSKVAQVLKDRPKLAIKVCGIAVQQDLLFYEGQQQAKQEKDEEKAVPQGPLVDEQQMAELGRQRAAAVKEYLVEKHQIPAGHLVGCQPRIETNKAEEKPRTDLLI
jgi:outer membrane protein OmpA-like peptidoglycan-associated protein